MDKPNLLLIVVDCLRSDFLLKEKGNARTPFLDTIRQRNVTFTSTITSASFTTPSFASLLTGLYPSEHNVRLFRAHSLGPQHLTVAQHLKTNGYHTVAYVTGPLLEAVGLAQGFDVYECRERQNYLDTVWGETLRQMFLNDEMPEPWFVLLHLWELHLPRQTAQGKLRSYLRADTYQGALATLDQQVERLWHSVTRGVHSPVVAALTGDHGEWVEANFFSWLRRQSVARLRRWTKGGKPKADWHGYHVYDYLVRVPLILWGTEDAFSHRTVRQQVRQIDIFPTLAEIVGIPVPDSVSGRSVWPMVQGNEMQETPAFMEASGGPYLVANANWLTGVRYQGWKFAYASDNPGRQPELYNLESDPEERQNLADRLPDRVRSSRELIEEHYVRRDAEEPMSASDRRDIEQRLRDLGYI